MTKNNCFKISLILFLSVLMPHIGLCQEQVSSQAISLSIEDAINTAFKNNKSIQIQEKEIAVANAGIMDARSQFLPKLGASAGYTRNGAVLTIPENPLIHYKKDMGIYTGYVNDNKLGLTLDQSIFNGGANIANYKQAELNLKVQKESLRATKLGVEFEAKRLYYGLLLAHETQRITQDLVNQAQQHYADVENKFKQGTSSRFDVLQSKVAVSKLMPELIKAKNAVDLIAADLKKLLGIKIDDELVLKDQLIYSAIHLDEAEFLKQAYFRFKVTPQAIHSGSRCNKQIINHKRYKIK